MGLAASQARLIGLGSKKTNCEWQGQQINQARTALANQTADLWNELLNMKVPNAPKVTDYTEPSYSFSDGQTDYEVVSVDSSNEKGYNAKVKYKYYQDTVSGVESSNTNPQVQKKSSATSDGGVKIEKLPTGSYKITVNGQSEIVADINDITDPSLKEQLVDAGVIKKKEDDVSSYVYNGQTYYLAGKAPQTTTPVDTTQFSNLTANYKVGNSQAQVADLTDITVDDALKKLAVDFPQSKLATAINAGEDIYTYSKLGTIEYACKADLEEAIASSSTIDNQKAMNQYSTTVSREEIFKTDDAILEKDSSGRYKSIGLKGYNGSSFDLHSESTTDMTSYDAAIKEYVNYKDQYEKTLEAINKKTAKIQEQDRTLELRLKNLDTERDALQNEMATVKKIMEKKVDEVFKTYQ